MQGKYIAGVYVRCRLTEPHHFRPFQFGVSLIGMPDHIDLSDIRPRLPGRESPDGLAYGNLNYQPNVNALQHICDKIYARTTEGIKYGKIIAMKNGAKQKAEITLNADAANLEAHANALNGVSMPQLGNTKVFFVERLRMYVAVERDFYKRHSKALKGIADNAWYSHHIEMKIFDGELRYAQKTQIGRASCRERV